MTELLRNRERPIPQAEQGAPSLEARRPGPLEQSTNREADPSSTRANTSVNRAIEQPPVVTTEKDIVIGQLEDALADELDTVYQSLPADKQLAFKDKGEAIARDIRQMVSAKKWQGHKVLKMVTEWLNMIPNVNGFYLRQMSKIKLDALADIYEAQQSNL